MITTLDTCECGHSVRSHVDLDLSMGFCRENGCRCSTFRPKITVAGSGASSAVEPEITTQASTIVITPPTYLKSWSFEASIPQGGGFVKMRYDGEHLHIELKGGGGGS